MRHHLELLLKIKGHWNLVEMIYHKIPNDSQYVFITLETQKILIDLISFQ